jgi:hypothetical protein
VSFSDPTLCEQNPLYVVGRMGEKRSHYVRAGKEWQTAKSLCDQEPETHTVLKWNARSSMGNVCNACHAEACLMPSTVKKAPDPYFASYFSPYRGRRQ